MDSSNKEKEEDISHDFPPFFKVHKNGRVERYTFLEKFSKYCPAGIDTKTGVQFNDVIVVPETGVKARIFLPKLDGTGEKLPLLVHYHGGAFCLGSPFDTSIRDHLINIVTQANVMAISIDYRLAPEHPLPIAYDDSWAGIQWIASHSNGSGPEPWLNQHADFGRVFLEGESAGANIAHYVAIQAGANHLAGLKIIGALIIHPYFGDKKPDELYKYMCPTSSGGDDDPKLNPGVDPNLKNMGCSRVLVCIAEKDWLKNRGVSYYETLSKSDWDGKVEFYESLGEDHCFYLFDPNGEKAVPLMKKMVDFINQE